jgi:hypothetical protein
MKYMQQYSILAITITTKMNLYSITLFEKKYIRVCLQVISFP